MSMKLARLHLSAKHEPIWHVQLAILVAIGLQLTLGTNLTIGPKYIIAAFEILLLLLLAIVRPRQQRLLQRFRRGLAFLLIGVVSAANLFSLLLVIEALFGGPHTSGHDLILSAISIFLTNIIIFGLWYWELDSNDSQSGGVAMDFFFPQSNIGLTTSGRQWQPTFFDYLYVSITNATAFSPTDTMPLTHRAKLLMTLQSMISLTTIALVAARAINILA